MIEQLISEAKVLSELAAFGFVLACYLVALLTRGKDNEDYLDDFGT